MNDKVKAAGIHFLLSLVIISFLMIITIYFWFPNSVLKVSNFKEISLLILGIDLVLGPLLTFVIFKPQKKGLKLDLSLIALAQVSALVFGMYNLYKIHPLYISFNIDRFTLVSADEALPQRAVSDEFKVPKFYSPKLVVSKIPEDIEEKNNLILATMESGSTSFELKSEYYHSYEDNINIVLEKSLDPSLIFKEQIDLQKSEKFLKKYGKNIDEYAYLPLEGTAKTAILVLDKNTAKPIDVIDVLPWKNSGIEKTSK